MPDSHEKTTAKIAHSRVGTISFPFTIRPALVSFFEIFQSVGDRAYIGSYYRQLEH